MADELTRLQRENARLRADLEATRAALADLLEMKPDVALILATRAALLETLGAVVDLAPPGRDPPTLPVYYAVEKAVALLDAANTPIRPKRVETRARRWIRQMKALQQDVLARIGVVVDPANEGTP